MKNRVISFLLTIIIIVTMLPISAYANAENKTEDVAEEVELKTNSVNMLNFLSELTQEVRNSSNSKLYLESVLDTITGNMNPDAVDEQTQSYLNDLIGTLGEFQIITKKRDRLLYIYKQKKAQNIREAIPNPLGLLSATNSKGDWKKLAMAVSYMAIDSVTSYKTANNDTELEYLKDRWDLDDREDAAILASKTNMLNYMFNMSREYKISKDQSVNANDIDDFVVWKNEPNHAQRLQFLEQHEKNYKMFGSYWLALASSYFEDEQYSKCLKAIETYEKLDVDIFIRDNEYAKIMPIAIASTYSVHKGDNLVKKLKHYADAIEENSLNDQWDLHYVAAQAYIELYKNTNDKAYLRKAYDITLNNVNELVKEQRKKNNEYISELDNNKFDVSKEALKGLPTAEQKERKNYNKLLEENRKKELVPISEALVLNCDLLFELADKVGITKEEKKRVDAILHYNGDAIFLCKPLDNLYTFNPLEIKQANVLFDGEELIIPVEYLTESAKIKVTVIDNKNTVFEDWELNKVEREEKEKVESFKAIYKSKSIKKYDYNADSKIKIEIIAIDKDNFKATIDNYKVVEYKDYKVRKVVKFGRAD